MLSLGLGLGIGETPDNTGESITESAVYVDVDAFYNAIALNTNPVSGTPYDDSANDAGYSASIIPGLANIAGGIYNDADAFFASTVAVVLSRQMIVGSAGGATYYDLTQIRQSITPAAYINEA